MYLQTIFLDNFSLMRCLNSINIKVAFSEIDDSSRTHGLLQTENHKLGVVVDVLYRDHKKAALIFSEVVR